MAVFRGHIKPLWRPAPSLMPVFRLGGGRWSLNPVERASVGMRPLNHMSEEELYRDFSRGDVAMGFHWPLEFRGALWGSRYWRVMRSSRSCMQADKGGQRTGCWAGDSGHSVETVDERTGPARGRDGETGWGEDKCTKDGGGKCFRCT